VTRRHRDHAAEKLAICSGLQVVGDEALVM
jgi:hypothetical protein